ncbi:MAG TPA: hypothetical protein VIG29_14655 [Vicinamibacteria bacterium]
MAATGEPAGLREAFPLEAFRRADYNIGVIAVKVGDIPKRKRNPSIILSEAMNLPGLPVTFRRPRLALAFSAARLLAVRAGDASRVAGRDLPKGLLSPSAVNPNIQSVRDLAQLASDVVDELSGRGGTASMILPDLAVVSAVLKPGERSKERDLEAELARRLAFPAVEARCDFWRGRHGEALGAAIREVVVRQYEQVVEAAECRLSWIDAAGLVRIPVWAETTAADPGTTLLRAQLYSSYYVLVLFRGGELVDVRTRLRAPGDSDAVAEEVQRLPAMYGVPRLDAITLSGEGASDCARVLSAAGLETRLSWEDEGEERQLEAALSTLLSRSS